MANSDSDISPANRTQWSTSIDVHLDEIQMVQWPQKKDSNSPRRVGSLSLRNQSDSARRRVSKFGDLSAKTQGKLGFHLQAVLIWAFIVIPANVVTLVLYFREQPSKIRVPDLAPDLGLESTTLCESRNGTRKLGANRSNALIALDFDCYESLSGYQTLLQQANFWLQGVAMFTIGLVGLFGNVITLSVLSRLRSNRNFNKLLMALALVDIAVIVFFVLDISICGQFLAQEPYWYRLLYPYVIHPIRNMTLTASIFMVVAISAERYKAICQTFGYRPSYGRYILIALTTTVCLEIPRFLEFRLMRTDELGIIYWTTHLMDNEGFIQFSSYWDDILCTGLIPFLALIYFNGRIYWKIRHSRNHTYRFVGKKDPQTKRFGPRVYHKTPVPNVEPKAQTTPSLPGSCPITLLGYPRFPNEAHMTTKLRRNTQKHLSPSSSFNPSDPRLISSSPSARKLGARSLIGIGQKHFEKKRAKSTALLISIVLIFASCHIYRFVVQCIEIYLSPQLAERHFHYCHEQGLHYAPVAIQVLVMVNHVFIVLNSSINFIVYSVVGKQFRQELLILFGMKPQNLGPWNHV